MARHAGTPEKPSGTEARALIDACAVEQYAEDRAAVSAVRCQPMGSKATGLVIACVWPVAESVGRFVWLTVDIWTAASAESDVHIRFVRLAPATAADWLVWRVNRNWRSTTAADIIALWQRKASWHRIVRAASPRNAKPNNWRPFRLDSSTACLTNRRRWTIRRRKACRDRTFWRYSDSYDSTRRRSLWSLASTGVARLYITIRRWSTTCTLNHRWSVRLEARKFIPAANISIRHNACSSCRWTVWRTSKTSNWWTLRTASSACWRTIRPTSLTASLAGTLRWCIACAIQPLRSTNSTTCTWWSLRCLTRSACHERWIVWLNAIKARRIVWLASFCVNRRPF